MAIRRVLLSTTILIGLCWTAVAALERQTGPAPGGFILERDAEVAAAEPGPHAGGGQTTAYSFFREASGLTLVFRKRALEPGSAIGYHLQSEDEIYYILSGRGSMTVDGETFDVEPGDAILTRPGSSHGLKQVGSEDLVLLINYEQAPRR